MNDKCRYCDYVSKCSRQCEYDSILCKINRSFPKIVNKFYQELEEANKKLYLCTPEIPQNVHGKYVSYVDLVNDVYELKKQQQEFINYLLKEIENKRRKSTGLKAFERNVIPLQQCLQKYKKIIGDDK